MNNLLLLIALTLNISAFGQTINGTVWYHTPPSAPDNYLLFTQDNKVIYSIDLLQAYVGKWNAKGDSIFIIFSYLMGKRGVGKVNEASSMDYPSYYKYSPFMWRVHYQAKGHVNNNGTLDLIFKNSYLDFRITEESEFNTKILNISIPGEYSLASIELVTDEDLKEYSKRELRIMRNEIFARYGYLFRSPELLNYFSNKEWYRPNKEVNDQIELYLSEIELKNIVTIKNAEK